MLDTETLTRADVKRLNDALRATPITAAGVREIAQGTGLGVSTVRRWFDATSNGDYSPCLDASVIGREGYLLRNTLADESDNEGEYGQGPNAYLGEDSDDTEDYQGGADPTQESMYLRILLCSLCAEGYEREPSTKADAPETRTTFTGKSKEYQFQASSLWQVVEIVRAKIGGQENRWEGKAWISFMARYDISTGGWDVDEISQAKDDDDPSP